MRAFEEFLQYKTRVPVRGAILLNEDMDSAILVKGYKKGANWSFPRGKINKDEDDLDCAIREVYEETGLDIRAAGLVPPPDEIKYIEITMREQQMRLYIFRNIPMDTYFEPKTRKEISKIEWYRLSELPAFRKKGNNNHENATAAAANPNKFYMVAPFLVPLKKWVLQQKKKDTLRAESLAPHLPHDEVLTEDDIGIHVEPSAELSRITPAIDTMEGATQELRRLLKIQPPTQGLQAAPPIGPGTDKGEELLAILQGGTGPLQASDAPSRGLPQTPLDLTHSTPSEPRTPHHHHPTQRAPLESYAPPPAFPVPPHAAQNRSANTYSQYHAQQMPAPQSPRQDHRFNAAVSYHHQQVHNYEPVPLMHPQPLPPQVQKTLLNRGMFASPGVPEAQANANSRYGTLPAGNKPPPAQLSNHAMSLLSAFKGGETKNAAAAPPTQASGVPLPGHGQSPGWSNAGPTSLQQPHAHGQLTPGTAPMGGQPLAELSAGKPRPHTDTHRSTLLEMFKQQVSRSPRMAEPRPSSAGRPIAPPAPQQPKPQAVHHQSLSNGKAIEADAQANGGPSRMNPDLNLPFGALSILSRQNESDTRPASISKAMNLPYSSETDSIATLNPTAASPRNPSRRPSEQYRGKPSPTTLPPQPTFYILRQGGHDYAQCSHPSQSSSYPASEVLPRQQDANPEQRQKLLSLFGKPPVSPSTAGPAGKGKGKEPLTSLFDHQARASPARVRLASLATAGSNEDAASSSRRGSQTPISPADRNFLLGYLESVSGRTTT